MKVTGCTLLLAMPMLAAWELSLLHVNDIHARMEETNKHSSPCTPKNRDAGKCYGGLARIVTAVKRVRNEDQVSWMVLLEFLVEGLEIISGEQCSSLDQWWRLLPGNALVHKVQMANGHAGMKHSFVDLSVIPYLTDECDAEL